MKTLVVSIRVGESKLEVVPDIQPALTVGDVAIYLGSLVLVGWLGF